MAVDTPARIAVLGAGPIGLETTLYARYLGYDVVLYERGRVCEHLLRWGHVRMFSPWRLNFTPLGIAALKAQDPQWQPPPADDLPTGRQLVEQYLWPLANSDLVADSVRQQHEVFAVGRVGRCKGDLVGDDARGDDDFRLLVSAGGRQFVETADVVIDTTGTYANANGLGQGGLPAIGERELAARIEYGLPDVLGKDRERYVGRHTLVVGAGYSAATNVVALAELARQNDKTRVTWVTRRETEGDVPEGPVSRIADDRLTERDRLARAANELAASRKGAITHWPGTWVEAITSVGDDLLVELSGEHAGSLRVGRVIANVGYRPDRDIYRELQVHECYATEGPMKLAAALSGNTSSDCLDQQSAGPQTLLLPEPNFYILGTKSYGRSSRFLLSAGHQQIRELFTIIGDRAELNLYATMEKLVS